MTFLESNNPTPAELETLRVECAKEVGWTKCPCTEPDCPFYLPPNFEGNWRLGADDLPLYSTSCDAIMPEIQKLEFIDLIKLCEELDKIEKYGSAYKNAFQRPTWQLALAWLRVKQQNKKEA